VIITLVAILISLGTVAYLAYPIFRRDRRYAPDPLDGLANVQELHAEKETLLGAIKDLEFDLASGKLSNTDYSAMRSKYEARALDVLQELDTQEAILRQPPLPDITPIHPTPSPAQAVGTLWSRPVFAVSVIGLLILIVGGGGFLLGRVTQDTSTEGMGREAGAAGMGNGAQMITALEARLTQNPRDLEALVGLGRIYLQTGQLPKAIEVYKRALDIDGTNVSALSGMAMILAQAGHSDQALMLFNRVLAINPQLPMALLFKGRILYEDKKDYTAAIASWEQFLRVMPQGGSADVVRGWIEEARTEARKAEEDGRPTKLP
jgi:cytochrome c-type biogenesis protein CcmH/NrfG